MTLEIRTEPFVFSDFRKPSTPDFSLVSSFADANVFLKKLKVNGSENSICAVMIEGVLQSISCLFLIDVKKDLRELSSGSLLKSKHSIAFKMLVLPDSFSPNNKTKAFFEKLIETLSKPLKFWISILLYEK